MRSQRGYAPYVAYMALFAVTFAAFVYPRLPFLGFPHWHMPALVLVFMLQDRREKRKAEQRFRERGEFACRIREVPGGGAGLSGRWRSAVVVPAHRRLSITGRAADRPPVSHPTWDEPIEEGLVQLSNVVEVSRREPTPAESLRLGAGVRIVRCQADNAVVEIAAQERYLYPVLHILKAAPAS